MGNVAVVLRFEEGELFNLDGKEAGQFVLDWVKEHPEDAVKLANQIDVRGDFGTVSGRV